MKRGGTWPFLPELPFFSCALELCIKNQDSEKPGLAIFGITIVPV